MPVFDSGENEAGRITARMLLLVFLVALGARALEAMAPVEPPRTSATALMTTSLPANFGKPRWLKKTPN